ncbi:PAS domain-containing protein [Erythrobacter litoralis]|uniref:histidine kinase n=1 Tax=Erythrobacter litoralis (strain HTCC2594) TaxID=314225 RepID=Q2N9L9_ERYLH|nr:PAS domain-containing protein [Erythrobacter litoralis]ABC63622.1 sensory box histidine kinase [Erythrobacter litoralis HTCC2594]
MDDQPTTRANRVGHPESSRQAYSSESGATHGSLAFPGASGLLFEQAMAQTRMAVCLTDPHQPDHPIVFCNAAFERLTGYEEKDIIGRNCRFLQGARTDESQVARIRDALAKEEVAVVELLNYRKDGSTFWNALHLGPIYDESGKLKYFFRSQWDVTDIHEARAEQRHAKAMAREVSHRLKNVFSVIAGIVNITGRSMDARPVASRINERVQALGRAYEPTLDEAFMGTIEVGQAIRAILAPYDPEGDRVSLEGNGVRTEPNAISSIGLTLHELASNAIKYGALSNETGTIDVSWHHERDDHDRRRLVIDWKESGGPTIEGPPETGGTGFDISETLLSYSNGTLEKRWDRDGLFVRIAIPIEQ